MKDELKNMNGRVTVKNLRYGKPALPWQVRVDRASALGNPFRMLDETQRDGVCDMYAATFALWTASPDRYPAQARELQRLKDLLNEYGRLELFCWCAPKRCHAETVREYLSQESGGKENRI